MKREDSRGWWWQSNSVITDVFHECVDKEYLNANLATIDDITKR